MERIIAFALCALIASSTASSQSRGMRQPTILPDQHRVALVVGNSRYSNAPLRNPANDAVTVSNALKQTGFHVLTYTDLDQKAMKKAIRSFGEMLTPGGVALFYYSGHGVQLKGANYLIPIKADIRNEGDVELEAVDANYVLNEMDAAKSRVNIVILDACRDDPLPRSVRSAARGLAQMNAPVGTIIAFSTSPGSIASDGTGRNGLYTQEFVKNVLTPGLPVETVFKRTLSGVKELSGGNQIPWTSYSIEGDFYFIPPTEQASMAEGATERENHPSRTPIDSSAVAISPPDVSRNVNYAATFDGRGSYVDVGASRVLQPQNVTVELWVKFEDLSFPFIPLLQEESTDHRTRANGFSLQYERNQFVFRLAKAYDTGIDVASTFAPAIGSWVHVAGTYDGYVIRLFINGRFVAETPFAGPSYYGARGFCLGVGTHWSFGGTCYLRGQLDEVRIWNIARTEEEIRSSMNRHLSGNEPGLVGYWNFDQTTVNGIAPDQTTNQNPAVLRNGITFSPSDVF